MAKRTTIGLSIPTRDAIYSRAQYPKESADAILRRLLGISSSEQTVKKEGEPNGSNIQSDRLKPE